MGVHGGSPLSHQRDVFLFLPNLYPSLAVFHVSHLDTKTEINAFFFKSSSISLKDISSKINKELQQYI